MQNEKESENAPARRRAVSPAESIRTFAAAVGTTAVLMLTVCGVLDLYLTPDETPQNVRAASVFGNTAGAQTIRTVQLGGDVFGIKLFSDGVIVAALSEIYADNTACCPAKEAGIQAGDYVITANGTPVETNGELAQILSRGGSVELTLRRGEEIYAATVTPKCCGNTYKAGMWVRDSAAGIGTVTFYSEDGTAFAALGHGICDSDTKDVLAIRSGEPAAIAICGIERGRAGEPGRLRGYFIGGESLGTLTQNTETGIYGVMSTPHESQTVEVLGRSDVRTGKVQIAATIDERGVQLFDAELERVSTNEQQETKTLIVRITDRELLEKTGGIVQGMSGCPILQDGKLAGAVTHVFVDDPTRGYGIFAETMLDTAA
ncbi:MAG: SpoIVB peptidase [Hominenteromicrobium sp.]